MDRRSFEQIYALYWKELLRFAYSHCRDLKQSEEFVQDVFLSLWERRGDFVVQNEIKRYLYTAVKYKVFDFFRLEHKKQICFDEVRLRVCDGECFTEQEVHFNELSVVLGHVIAKLSCRCREVYRLSREQGLANKDIARQLDISEKTVEQHLTKAIRYIRLNLKLHS